MTTEFDPPGPVLREVVRGALAEDLGVLGDITSIACVGEDQSAVAAFVAREEGVLAGSAAATEVFRQVDEQVVVEWNVRDGEGVDARTELGRVTGPLRSILTGERVALNLLCHCSGVASLTRRYVRAARGKARIRDTRKTLPGLRALEKAAVRAGGGFNHRDSLSDAVLIKDNHLAALGLTRAVERARSRWPGRVVEVECDSLEQVEEARSAGVDLVLLDNMTPEEVAKAVELLGGTVRIEVSGGVSLDSVGAYAEAGVDFIAIGAITHSARALDIGLDVL
ncbi:MAG: nicotinate-nucleotide diphosphorylase (carboxylating) [Acidimicrobiia bacterium]|nr:MAG: nicotinate-nucleotide diphosphorylase (carboxylating) [Acidimicrobiia bacterium]